MEEIVQELFEQGVLIGTEVGAVRRDRPPEGARGGVPLQIPTTVQAVLAARIDRLTSEEKALLQQLAVIGRQFPLSLIRQVIPQPEADLYRLLASLQRKEFLYEQPAFPESEYIFKHALTQEVAYGTVLQEQKKLLHERTGQAIEQIYKDKIEEHYSELAHHYQRSADTQKAVEYVGLAGAQAMQRSANIEAIDHLTTALALLKTLPDTPERTRQELTLQVNLGVSLIATKGYAAPEVGKTYTRAWELCQQTGGTTQLFPVLGGLWQFHIVRAEFQTARKIGELVLSLAQNTQDPAFLVEAHDALGQALYCLGELSQAQVHLEQSLRFYNPQHHSTLTFLCGGEDPGVACRDFAAWALWSLGYPDQALTMSHAALNLAREVTHFFSLGHALSHTAGVHLFRGERQVLQERVEEVITLSTEQEFALFWAWGTILRGLILVEQKQKEEGVARMRQGLEAWRATGAEVFLPYLLALLAEACKEAGQIEEGLTTLTEALAQVDKTGERFYEAELYRLKGELLLMQENQKSKGKGQKSKIETDP